MNNKVIYETPNVNGEPYGKLTRRDLLRFKDTARYLVPQPKSLLDVGCFSGEWLHFVLDNQPSIHQHLGIDVAQNKIDEAKRRFPEINVQCGFAEDLKIVAGSFEVVTCLEVLEHIPDWLSLFNSFFTFASRQVIVTVPNREKIIQTPCIHCGKLTPLYGHLRSYNEESFPDVGGWTKSFYRIKDRNPDQSLALKAYHFLFPHYSWFLVDYRKIS